MAKSFVRLTVLALLMGALARCSPTFDSSSETHFVHCMVDADCARLGPDYRCEDRVCTLRSEPVTDGGIDASAREPFDATAFDAATGVVDSGRGATDADAALVHGWQGERTVSAIPPGPVQDVQVGVAADGTAFVVKTDNLHVYVDRYVPGRGWDATASVFGIEDAAEIGAVDLAVSANGDALLAWDVIAPAPYGTYRMRAARYTASGGWATPAYINEPTYDFSGGNAPEVRADAVGDFCVAWFDAPTNGVAALHAVRFDHRTGFAPSHDVVALEQVDGGQHQSGPVDIAMNLAGDTVLTWSERMIDLTVRVLRWTRAGAWSSPLTLATVPLPPQAVGNSAAAIDDAGHAAIVWSEVSLANQHAEVKAAVLSQDSTTYELATLKQQAFTLPFPFLEPPPIVRVAADSNGAFTAAWVAGGNAYARQFSVGSAAWSSTRALAEHVPDGGPANASSPELAMSASGATLVRWDWYSGEGSNALVQAATLSGSTGGTSTTLGSSPTATDYAGNHLVMDPSGNGTVIWGNATGLWAIRFEVGAGWGASTAISTEKFEPTNAAIAVGESGEVVVAWHRPDGASVAANVYR